MTENFSPEEKLVRACWPKLIKKSGKVSSAAFKPRQMQDGKFEGVSVFRTHTRTLDDTVKNLIPRFHAGSRFVYITVLLCTEIGVYIKNTSGNSTDYHVEIYSHDPDIPLTPEESKMLGGAAIVYTVNVEST